MSSGVGIGDIPGTEGGQGLFCRGGVPMLGTWALWHGPYGVRHRPKLTDAVLHWPSRLRPEGATSVDPAALAVAEALQDELVGELLGADVLLVGAPLYNYSVPSSLKTWIDHVDIPGRTAPFVDAPTADGGTARRGRL